MVDPKIVLLIFVSGKVVLTGAKKREEIYAAFENIYPVLKEFKKGALMDSDPPPLPQITGPRAQPSATPSSDLGSPPSQL